MACMYVASKNAIYMTPLLHPWVIYISALDLQFVLFFQTFYNSPLTSQVSQILGVHHLCCLQLLLQEQNVGQTFKANGSRTILSQVSNVHETYGTYLFSHFV